MSELADLLAGADDLGAWRAALVREQAIRQAMAETGEPREIVTEALDAAESMGQEAVLDLTEGEPTSLADGLRRYVDGMNAYEEETGNLRTVADDLAALLAYPWPGEAEQRQADAARIHAEFNNS